MIAVVVDVLDVDEQRCGLVVLDFSSRAGCVGELGPLQQFSLVLLVVGLVCPSPLQSGDERCENSPLSVRTE